MFKIKNIVILLLSTFALNSSQEKQLIKLNDKGCLSVVTQIDDIKKIIADYLEDKWKIDKIIETIDFDVMGDDVIINQAKFSPNGKYIACAYSGFRDIKIFDSNTEKEVDRLVGHTKSVQSIDYSSDGKSLASGSTDKTIKIWDLNTGLCKKTIDNGANISFIKFSSDGNIIAFIEKPSGNLKILDLKSDHLYDLKEDKYAVNSLAFSPIENQLASTYNNSIKIWSYTQNIIPHLFVLLKSLDGHRDRINCLGFSTNGQFIASGSEDKTIKVWDIKSGNCVKTFEADEYITTIAFSFDGNYIISGATKHNQPGHRPHGRIKIWDIKTGDCIQDINCSAHFNSWVEKIRSIECQPGRILSTGYSCIMLKNEKFNALYQ